jgi:hypothetical protein
MISGDMTSPDLSRRDRAADWLGLNRATVAVLTVIGFLGLSEEVWSPFLSLHFKQLAAATNPTNAVAVAALFTGVVSSLRNLLEGFGYIVGGSIAHRMGPRVALAVSAIPSAIGFSIMLSTRNPWIIAMGALMMSNWEPLSVPATFAKCRRTAGPLRSRFNPSRSVCPR